MRVRSLFLLLASSLLAQLVRLPIQHRSSSIDTIAGGESFSVPANEFSPMSISGLAADSQGNIYFSIQAKSQVFRLGRNGQVTLFAGNGVRQRHVDGALATESPLLDPRSLAVNRAGDLYITCDDALARVDAGTHVVSTILQTPYSAPGSLVGILEINEMIVGPDDNLYFSDGADWRIKSYSFATGAVTVLAGNGALGTAQTDVPATSTTLRYPQSVAVGSDGTVYFSTLEPRVFRITPKDGILQTLSIDLPGQNALLGDYDIPGIIAADDQNHLFVSQPNRSRVLQVGLKHREVTIYAGTGHQGFNGDHIPAVDAFLTGPSFLAWVPPGNLIIVDNWRIRSVDSITGMISTRTGNGGSLIDDPSTLTIHAKLWEPAYAVAARDGSVYITSSFTNRLMRRDANGDLVSVAGGGNFARMGSGPGPAPQVALVQPQGVWLDNDGTVFFSDDDNRIIRYFDPVSGSVTNFAVTPKKFNSFGLFLYYAGALISDDHYFYLSDPNCPCVWRISRKDRGVELYLGRNPDTDAPGNDNSPAHLKAPAGLALDSARNLYIADGSLGGSGGRILRVDAVDHNVTTVLSGLRQPSGLAFQSPDRLCFSESGGNQVGCLDLKRRTVRIVAGTGVGGFSGDNGPAECAQLNRPSGISFDRLGRLYIADTGNQRIRRVSIGTKPVRCPPEPYVSPADFW